jgi:Cytochrome bd terminal oxidase subunit I
MYRRLRRFFGMLLLINVAVGVVTGLVQEFEFGINWPTYSRFVGDVSGGPLAVQGAGGVLSGVDVMRPERQASAGAGAARGRSTALRTVG